MVSDLLHLARETRRRPFSFLLRKLRDRLFAKARSVLEAVGGRPYATQLSSTRQRSQILILGTRGLDRALTHLRQNRPQALDNLLRQAERIMGGQSKLLSVDVDLRPPIDWHYDPASGRRWPFRFHTRYRYADILDWEHPSDIKVPWEMSRLQYLPVLALAARVSGEERFAGRAAELMKDFRRNNPVGYGVGWAIGMEASLRAISLIWTAEILSGTAWEDRFDGPELRNLLAEHGRFIYRNLEYSDISGNHYTSCLVGLLYLGLYLPEERESSKWVRLAQRELEGEIVRQVYPDGVCHEGSIPYHRLVLELFLHAAVVCRRRGIELEDKYLERLERMFEFVAAYSKPDGLVPVWGDADDGRVLSVGHQPINDHRYLLGIGAAFCGRADLWAHADGLSLDALILIGALEGETIRKLPPTTAPKTKSKGFEQGGFYVIRRKDDYCMIDCGDVGLKGRGGHGHNDALSVEVSVGGRDLLVDSGCSSYTRSIDERLRCIAASAHNVAIVDQTEPAPLSRQRFPHATACPVQVLLWDAASRVFVGRHFGFASLGVDYYERRVETGRRNVAFVISDRIAGKGSHEVHWHFQLAAGWEAELRGEEIRCARATGPEVRLRWSGATLSWSIRENARYPQYGNPQKHCRLRASTGQMPLPLYARFEIEAL
ncbi:MAG TPA: alginate lyase family protein [Acidobacteriota bacterium]|nr:alginate lyase family protein [Acidobacteriota bacterium]